MERFSCINVKQSNRWKDVLDTKVMHEKTYHTKTACTNDLPEDEHTKSETRRRNQEFN